MKSRKSFWFGTLVVVALGLAVGAAVADRIIHQPVETAEASWKEVFKSPRGLVRSVDVIALAQALDVAPGRVAVSDKGEGPMPFQLVEFEILHAVKGAAPGDRFTVERAGGVSPGGRKMVVTADGGEFVPGQAYLLFLKQQPDSPYFYQVNDQGRYHLKGNHLMAVSPDDPVATRLHGATLAEGLARVEAALGRARPSVPIEK